MCLDLGAILSGPNLLEQKPLFSLEGGEDFQTSLLPQRNKSGVPSEFLDASQPPNIGPTVPGYF